jgi:hypothetical protein
MGTIKRNFSNNVTPTGKFDSADLTGTIPATNVADASLTNITSVPAPVGDFVQKVASDPSPTSAGDVWYNTTSNALKSLLTLEAWSSGSPLTTARRDIVGAGTQTAALGFSGGTTIPAPVTISNTTEEYNGSGWASSGNLNTTRVFGSGTGTQTAGLSFGGGTSGSPPYGPFLNTTEEYDGSTWTNVPGTLATARNLLSGAGIQTAALAITGYNGTVVNNVEEYDGTSWTAGGNVGSTRYNVGAAGTLTAGLAFGGSGGSSATEEYDGSSWTAGGTLNTGRNGLRGSGLQTAAIGFGGNPTTGATEKYDGSTWTTSPATLATARYNLGSAVNGTSSSTLAFGGRTDPAVQSVTEEYNSSTNVITPAAWASGGNLSTARYGGAPSTSGTQTSTFYAGGANVPGAPTAGLTEEYNGTSWTSGGTLPPASPSATRDGMGGAGTLTAGLAFSGAPPLAGLTDTDEYDGSTWTAANPFNTARYSVTGTGTQTAGLMMGGFSYPPPTNYNNTEEYDGTSWTAGGTLATATRGMGSSGLQTAGLAYGGETPTTVATSQEYDGTSWTIGNSLNTARSSITGFGIQTNSIAAFGGPGQKTDTEQYDGTTWRTAVSATNGRRQAGGSGSSTAGLGFGGYASASQLTATEEFTGETSAANVVTISSS